MAITIENLPKGFVLDKPPVSNLPAGFVQDEPLGGNLPEGFVLDEPVTAPAPPVAVADQPDFLEEFITTDKPVEEWLPGKQGAIARQALDSFEKPDDERRRISNAILLSSMFDTNFNDMMAMEPDIMQEIYGDALTDMAKRFKTEPFEAGFFGKIGEAWRRGSKNLASDIAAFDAVFEGRGDIQEVLAARSKTILNEQLTPIESNILSNLVYKSAQLLPGVVKGFWSAIPEAAFGMVTAAGLATAAGQVPPLTFFPEELVTVPPASVVGFGIGLKMGAAMFWYKQGAGNMVASMLEKGYDPEVSKNVAGIAGIPYAVIEFMQIQRLTPGLRETVLKSVGDTMIRVIGKAAKKYGGTLTNEVLEEIAQEIIAIAAEDISGILSDADIEFDREFAADRMARIWETAKEATQGMALLPVPGAAIDINTGVRSVLSERRLANIRGRVTAPPVSDFIQERFGPKERLETEAAEKQAEDVAALDAELVAIQRQAVVEGKTTDEAIAARVEKKTAQIEPQAAKGIRAKAVKAEDELIALTEGKELEEVDTKKAFGANETFKEAVIEEIETVAKTLPGDLEVEVVRASTGTIYVTVQTAEQAEEGMGEAVLDSLRIADHGAEGGPTDLSSIIVGTNEWQERLDSALSDMTLEANKLAPTKPPVTRPLDISEPQAVEGKVFTPAETALLELGASQVEVGKKIEKHGFGGITEAEQHPDLVKASNVKKQKENNLYDALEPEHPIGSTVTFQNFTPAGTHTVATKQPDGSFKEQPNKESTGKAIEVEITKANFDVSKAVGTQIKTGFPSTFRLTSLEAVDINSGDKIQIGPTDLINGKSLSETVTLKPEDVLSAAIKKRKQPSEAKPPVTRPLDISEGAEFEIVEPRKAVGVVPGTNIVFDSVRAVGPENVMFFKDGEDVHLVRVETKVEQDKLVADSKKILGQPTATEIPEIPAEKRIISKEAFEAARKRLSDPGTLRTGFSAQDLKDAAIVGGYFVETGVRKFADFSAKMIKELGEAIQPHLQQIWDTIQVDRDIGLKAPLSRPSKAEQQVIDANKFNKDLAEQKNTTEKVPIETEKVDDTDEPLGRTMTDEWYESNAKKYNKSVRDKISDAARRTLKGIDKVLGATSTRLNNIAPELFRRTRRHVFNVMTRSTEQTERLSPFLKLTKKLDKNTLRQLDLAFKNSDGKKIAEIAAANGMTAELKEVRAVLNEIYNAANAVGLEIDYRKNYMPRVVKDTKGFLEFFQKGDDWSIVRNVIEAKESQRGRVLTEAERAAAVNTLLRGYRTSALTLTAPGAAKARTVDEITAEINQFYHDFRTSLTSYIRTMNEKISSREFFGRESKEITKLRAQQSRLRTRLAKLGVRKTKQKPADADTDIRIGFETGTLTEHIGRVTNHLEEVNDKLERMGADDLSNTVGNFVINLITNDEIKPSQEKEVRDLLMGMFDPQGTHGLVGDAIALTYIDVLGSPLNAITQLEELGLAFYRSPLGFVPEAVKATLNLSDITTQDIGVTSIGEEFFDADFKKALSAILAVTGFEKIDRVGKQTFINTVINKMRNQAKKPTKSFMDRLRRVFGDETAQVIEDLKSGEVTDNVKYLAFNQLLDIQPVAKSEMPEAYNRAGNLRILYTLKTFMIKQIDFVRTEAFEDMKSTDTFMRGLGRLTWLAFSLALFGAGADFLKDFLRGRPFDLRDSVVDTFLRRIFFSKFQFEKAMSEGFGRAFLQGFVPPTKAIDGLTKDMKKVWKDPSDAGEILRSVPIVGELYYWWFGRGREKAEKEQKKARRDAVRRKPLFTGTKQ